MAASQRTSKSHTEERKSSVLPLKTAVYNNKGARRGKAIGCTKREAAWSVVNKNHSDSKTKGRIRMYHEGRKKMAKYRKLGKTSSQRKALLRNQVTMLVANGKITTTEARAKEIQKIVEGLVALAVKERDNFETVTVTAKVPQKDKDGRRVKEVVDGKKVTVYDEVEKEIKKDLPSRLHARRQMLKVFYDVVENPDNKKKTAKQVDLVAKMFEEIAPKYADRNGGYTRIIKIGPRKGDAAMMAVIEFV